MQIGSRVACLTLAEQGVWSEYSCIPASACYVMPENMTFEEAAAIPGTYLTAYFLLFNCSNLGARKSVLIHMAAGGVVRISLFLSSFINIYKEICPRFIAPFSSMHPYMNCYQVNGFILHCRQSSKHRAVL